MTDKCQNAGLYYVYIMTNVGNTVLYTGVMSDLGRRVSQHMAGAGGRFTAAYKVKKLVYFETFGDGNEAIAREKQIKRWRREWKRDLISKTNPGWAALNAA